MLASAQSVLHRAVVPIVAAAGFAGRDWRIVRQRTTDSVSLAREVLIADARTGVVEASHLQ